MKENDTIEIIESSMDYAGGVAVGAKGYITNFNADAQARLANALMEIGKWIDEETGVFLGHIKCGIYLEDGTGITLNLTSTDSGVEIHGVMEPAERVGFSILCAALDVDKHELDHSMMHALEDTFLDIEYTEGGHSHDNDHRCDCDEDCDCVHNHHQH